MLTQYQLGAKNGRKDALDKVPPRGSRLWQADYRRGYSDGFWKARGKPTKY